MPLTSSAYLTFAAIVFLAYWLVSRFRLAGLALILVANYFFYARWSLIYLALVPAASSIDFVLGRALAPCEGAKGGSRGALAEAASRAQASAQFRHSRTDTSPESALLRATLAL